MIISIHSLHLSSSLFFNKITVQLRTSKNCTADHISCRLAGYWYKFSISNNRASDEPHRLRYYHCAKLPNNIRVNHLLRDAYETYYGTGQRSLSQYAQRHTQVENVDNWFMGIVYGGNTPKNTVKIYQTSCMPYVSIVVGQENWEMFQW